MAFQARTLIVDVDLSNQAKVGVVKDGVEEFMVNFLSCGPTNNPAMASEDLACTLDTLADLSALKQALQDLVQHLAAIEASEGEAPSG